jgi:hypothetical protein
MVSWSMANSVPGAYRAREVSLVRYVVMAVRLGEDLEVAQLDRVGHQQPERGHEQRGDPGRADVRRGNVDPEPVHSQVAAVAEGDDSIEGRPVLGHRGSALAVGLLAVAR